MDVPVNAGFATKVRVVFWEETGGEGWGDPVVEEEVEEA